MTKEMEFFVFLIEQYAKYKGTTADVVMKEWDDHNITDNIYNSYEMYHSESLENAYKDIDSLLTTGKHVW